MRGKETKKRRATLKRIHMDYDGAHRTRFPLSTPPHTTQPQNVHAVLKRTLPFRKMGCSGKGGIYSRAVLF